MGLFSSHKKKAAEFRAKARKPGLSPEQRRQLLMKALMEDDKAGDPMAVAETACALLVRPGVARDIGALRAQLQMLKDPKGASSHGTTLLADLQELEELGLGKIGTGEEEIRAFLQKAAAEGSAVAADFGQKELGWEGFEESYRRAALRGRFKYSDSTYRGFRFTMAKSLSDQLDEEKYPKGSQRIGGIVGGEEYRFWRGFDRKLMRGGIPPYYEEGLAQLNAAREADPRAAKSKENADKLFPQIREELENRLTDLRAKLSPLTVNVEDGRWLEPQNMEVFCDWLLANATLHVLQDHRMPPEEAAPAPLSAEVEILFREGRIEEHLGRDYRKAISRYQQAAEQGHGEAAWRLHRLLNLTDNRDDPWYQRGQRLAMAAGYPGVPDLYDNQKDSEYFSLIRLTRKGNLDALYDLMGKLCNRWRLEYRHDPFRYEGSEPWRMEADIAVRFMLARNKQLSLKDDPEADFRLFYAYGSYEFEYLGLREMDPVGLYRDRCFKRGFGLAYYLAARNDIMYFVNRPSHAARIAWAEIADEAGIPGAASKVRADIEQAERLHAMHLQKAAEFQRTLETWKQEKDEAQYRQAAEARRQAIEAGMDEYRERRDWAERSISAFTGGSGGTLEESYLRGEVDIDSYGTAGFIRSEREDALRRRLEKEYDAAHHLDEE